MNFAKLMSIPFMPAKGFSFMPAKPIPAKEFIVPAAVKSAAKTARRRLGPDRAYSTRAWNDYRTLLSYVEGQIASNDKGVILAKTKR